MDYKTVILDELTVIGITKQTQDEKDKVNKDRQTLLKLFQQKHLGEKFPQFNNEMMYLHTDYREDITQPYSLVLGYKASNIDSVPEGMICKMVPSSKYAVFHIRAENVIDELLKTWAWINTSALQRTYTGDFETYKPPNGHEVDIYVAIK